MAHEDHGTAIFQNLLDGGHGSPHAGVIGYLELFVQGNIEINPDQCFESLEIELIKFVHWNDFKKQARQGCCRAIDKVGLLGDQLCEVVHGANELAYIAHLVVVPAHYANQLGIAYVLYFGLGGIEE